MNSNWAKPTGLLLAVLLALSALLPAAAPTTAAVDRPVASTAQSAPYFEPAGCMYDEVVAFVEGQDVECGYLVVPETYANPGGPTIRLAVAILRASDPNPKPDPIVMAQGGPGASTIATYLQVFSYNDRLRGDRDYIFFDQRGTKYSDPALTCPELMDFTIEYLDDDIPDEELIQLSMDTVRACRERLVAEGVNLSAYDSVENAHDVESLRVALGYEQINLYGVSYGTLLAQHVLRDFPQGLRSVTLDSVVSTEVNFFTNAPQTMNASFEKLFAACAADVDCNRVYPNLRQVFYDLVDQWNASPVMLPLTDFETFQTHDALFNGDALMSTLFQMLYSTELIPYLPRTIYAVRDGDTAFFERLSSLLTFDRSLANGMYYSVMCAEDADFTVQDYNLENLPPQIVEMEDTSAQMFLDVCSLWDVETLPAAVDDPVQSDVPVLLLSGAFDPVTPPAYAERAAQTLPNSYQFVFNQGAHGALGSGECQDQIFLDFIDNPNQAPDASCIQETTAPAFVTPKDVVAIPVLIKLLNFQDGTGWQLGLYMLALLFLLTALLAYPLAWVVRRLRSKPAPAPVVMTEPGAWAESGGYIEPSLAPERGLYRFAPWLSAVTGMLLLIFTVILVVIIVRMVTENDMMILVGLPGSARVLFVLPLLALLAALGLAAAMLTGWLRRAGSVWGRLYSTLLTIAAFVALGVLALWGMLSAVF